MQALKTLVIVMGIAIVVALAIVVYGIAGRSGPEEAGRGGFGEVVLEVPAGCTIAEAAPEGERLILRLDGLAERGCQQVLVVELATGRLLGRLTARPGS